MEASIKNFPKLVVHLVNYNYKVIIGDGAKWIQLVDSNYPGELHKF
jgi:hypothetical protein